MSTVLHGYIPEVAITQVRKQGAYSYNQARRFKLLQRVCLWILRRLRCEHFEAIEQIATIEFDTQDVIEMARKQVCSIEQCTFQWPKYVIVGRKQEMQLMKQNHNRQMTFDLSFGKDARLMGMTLIVAPWFDGVVCLSELS